MNEAWRTEYLVGTWQLAQTAKMDKKNGKEGTKSLRLKSVGSVGKVFYTKINEKCRDEKFDFAYGYYGHRRREQALLVHHAVVWRLMEASRETAGAGKNNYSFVATLRDISNAFPSMSHESMDKRMKNLADPKPARFLATRHGNMHVQVNTKTGGDLVVKPGAGGAQGDGVMPTVFRRTYELELEDRMEDKKGDLESEVRAQDPVTKKMVNVSDTVFADDLKEINLVRSADEAVEAVARSGVLLDQKLEAMKMKQNVEKAEHVLMFLGAWEGGADQGSDEETRGCEPGESRISSEVSRGTIDVQWESGGNGEGKNSGGQRSLLLDGDVVEETKG